jgi:hypothetical protein
MPYSSLTVTKIGDVDDRAIWMLHEPLTWENGIVKIVVPAGFQCDFASIPQFALSILGDIGQEAGVIHDFLYREDAFMDEIMGTTIVTHQPSREQADWIFFQICGEMGIEWWKRTAMYKAVRLAAGKFWHERKVMEPFMEEYVI